MLSYPRNNIWHSGKDYDIGGESIILKEKGVPFIKSILKDDPGLNNSDPSIVDFGCWSGRHVKLLKRIARDKGEVIGIDAPFAKDRLTEAKNTYKGIEFKDTGILDTQLSPSSIDAAICWRVLHNLTILGEFTAAILEFKRVLKNGAPLVIAVRAILDWMSNAPTPLIYRTYYNGGEREDLYFSEDAISTVFPQYGFIINNYEFIHEDELIDKKRLTNNYWMINLICTK